MIGLGGQTNQSIGGNGASTPGGAVTTLASNGATRNTLDDGSGNMIVKGDLATAARNLAVNPQTGNYAVGATDDVIPVTAATGVTVTLPAVNTVGRRIIVIASGAGAVTVSANGGTIDGSATLVIAGGAGNANSLVCVAAPATWTIYG